MDKPRRPGNSQSLYASGGAGVRRITGAPSPLPGHAPQPRLTICGPPTVCCPASIHSLLAIEEHALVALAVTVGLEHGGSIDGERPISICVSRGVIAGASGMVLGLLPRRRPTSPILTSRRAALPRSGRGWEMGHNRR